MSLDESNRFTIKDMADALQSFEDKRLVTYPLDVITKRSGIDIKKNKRNGRTQKEHIKLMNFVRDEINQNTTWNKVGNGRKSKKDIVLEWRTNNPLGKKIECHKETGLSRATIDKWWD
ncbi:hypothetical protein ACGCUQ_08365 (plasmid) [Eubacteriales bacterium KG127]